MKVKKLFSGIIELILFIFFTLAVFFYLSKFITSSNELQHLEVALAESESTPSSILAQLSGSPFEEVRIAVAKNPNTPAEALILLSTDRFEKVRKAANEQIKDKIKEERGNGK